MYQCQHVDLHHLEISIESCKNLTAARIQNVPQINY